MPKRKEERGLIPTITLQPGVNETPQRRRPRGVGSGGIGYENEKGRLISGA